jgi:predicted nucleotidyltransferase
MSKKSEISFDQIPDLPGLEDTLRAVDRAFARFGINYFLVGAFARDVWAAYLQDATSPVKTKDIDFAVQISGMDEFQTFKDHLVRAGSARFVPASMCWAEPKG